MAGDLVREMIERAIAIAPDAASSLRRLELDMRQEWGGERWYIAKMPARCKALQLGELIASGAAPMSAVRELGFPDSTGYRCLRRKVTR